MIQLPRVVALLCACSVSGFFPHLTTTRTTSRVVLTAVDIAEVESLEIASNFMVNAFWLNSPQGLVTSFSPGDLQALVSEQLNDLQDKYGERMGRRSLDTRLLQATNDNKLVGIVGVEVSLLDKNLGDIIPATQSEELLKNAVASLGPKQRRQYMKSSAREIAMELLPAHLEPVAVLSNLVVSPDARRQGIAKELCSAVETIAKEEWGYEQVYLRVESANEAAKKLYKTKLGFASEYTLLEGTGIRVNDGRFAAVPAEILVMVKSL